MATGIPEEYLEQLRKAWKKQHDRAILATIAALQPADGDKNCQPPKFPEDPRVRHLVK